MFEYLNISDVDALRSLIEKLIADADEFAADIRKKDHTITELQIKVRTRTLGGAYSRDCQASAYSKSKYLKSTA